MDSSPEYSGNSEFMLPSEDETDSDLSSNVDFSTNADQPKDQELSAKNRSDTELFAQGRKITPMKLY